MEKTELERAWLDVLQRLQHSRGQGCSCVLTSQEIRILLSGIESFEDELIQLRSDQGPLVPMVARTQDDAPVVTS